MKTKRKIINIFAVNICPIISAQSLVDKHVLKLILESSTMLCLAHSVFKTSILPKYFYKSKSYKNHPCSKWVRQTKQNYLWLAKHNVALCDEFEYRYGKTHKVRKENLDNWLLENIPIKNGELTPFVEVTDKIHEADGITTYRKYYLETKKHLFVWTKREPPEWIKNNCSIIYDGKWKILN